ncbi:hypothetical protein L596_030273 [Steinernema carpocapsae]|uniref:LNR domain-containing protein n=1 Tax=Steinernema carpocapsae TaxID=34508 RepID=A0A4U5LNW7_STECR|nr:hypothetical protein L596_030273 [Steinernema carpocapsae]
MRTFTDKTHFKFKQAKLLSSIFIFHLSEPVFMPNGHSDLGQIGGLLAVELRTDSLDLLATHLTNVEMVFNAATRAVFTVGKQANGRLTLESVENISKTQYDSAYKIVKVRFRVDTTVYYGQQHHGCFRKSDVILIIGDHPHINVFRYLKMHTIFRFGIRVRNVTVEKDELEEAQALRSHVQFCRRNYGNDICDDRCAGQDCVWDGGNCFEAGDHPQNVRLLNCVILVLYISLQQVQDNLFLILCTLQKTKYKRRRESNTKKLSNKCSFKK